MKLISSLLCLCIASFQLFAQSNLDKKALTKLSNDDLDSLFSLSFQNSQYEDAISYAEVLAEKTKASKEDSIHADCMENIATTYFYLGKQDLAESYYLKVLAFRKEKFSKEHPGYANILNNLGVYYKGQRRYEEAEKYYLECINLRKRILGEKHKDYILSINNLAVLYYSTSKYTEAEFLYKKAIELTKDEQSNQNPNYALGLNNLASLYYAMGKYASAEPLFKQAADIWLNTKGEDYAYYALAINNLAMSNLSLRKYEEAKQLFIRVLELRKKTVGDKHSSYATALNNLSLCYSSLGQYDRAEKSLLQAKDIWKKTLGDQDPDYAHSLINLAKLYESMQRSDKAEKLLLQAIDIMSKSLGRSNPRYITAINSLADLYKNEGKIDKALEYYQLAISNNEKTHQLPVDYKALAEKSYFSDSHILSTLKGLQESYQIEYRLHKEDHYLLDAYLFIQTALQIGDKVRNEFGSEADKLRLLGDLKEFTDLAIASAIDLSKNKDKNKFLAEAFVYAEQNKSVLLADATKAQRARSLGDLPDSLALIELNLQQELSKLKKQVLEERDSLKKIAFESQLNELNLEIENFKKKIESNYPKYYQLKYASITVNAATIQASLDEHTALLEYFVSDSTVHLFYIDKEGLQHYGFAIPKELLSEQIKALRKALSDYEFIAMQVKESDQLYVSAAHWFYKELLQVALEGKQPKITNLIIIADGELGHLPFETFLTEAVSPTKVDYTALPYLLNQYQISYNYSATLWKENTGSEKKTNNGQMYALAASYGNKEEDETATRTVRAPHLRNLRDVLIDLPAAKEEVKGLSELFNGSFVYDKDANESNFKQNASKFGILHLAMHGILDERYPILSSLALTEDGDSLEDNFLQACEIAHLDLHADLVVLSACETGFGKFLQGEGVMSLARSFMYAGTPSLVVSMWQVNDQSTSLIMQAFYKNLAKGMNKAEALRQAKLYYIQNVAGSRSAHPAFWAPFIQLGDSQPINLSSKNGAQLVYWVGGLGILAMGSLVWIRRKRVNKEL